MSYASSMKSSTSNRAPPPRACVYPRALPVPGTYVSSAQHQYRTKNFCELCTTFIPLPATWVRSVRPRHNTRGTGTAFSYCRPQSCPHARACAHTRPRHRRGVGERPHVRGSIERTASLAVAKTRCRGGQTRWPWRAEWPLQGIPSENAASGGCGPISTNHLALFGLSCTRFYPAPCFGHIPRRYTLFCLVNNAFLAKIGYLSISVFATPPGRHLIGRRRPPPDDGHTSAG